MWAKSRVKEKTTKTKRFNLKLPRHTIYCVGGEQRCRAYFVMRHYPASTVPCLFTSNHYGATGYMNGWMDGWMGSTDENLESSIDSSEKPLVLWWCIASRKHNQQHRE